MVYSAVPFNYRPDISRTTVGVQRERETSRDCDHMVSSFTPKTQTESPLPDPLAWRSNEWKR